MGKFANFIRGPSKALLFVIALIFMFSLAFTALAAPTKAKWNNSNTGQTYGVWYNANGETTIFSAFYFNDRSMKSLQDPVIANINPFIFDTVRDRGSTNTISDVIFLSVLDSDVRLNIITSSGAFHNLWRRSTTEVTTFEAANTTIDNTLWLGQEVNNTAYPDATVAIQYLIQNSGADSRGQPSYRGLAVATKSTKTSLSADIADYVTAGFPLRL